MGLPKAPYPAADLRTIYLHWTAGDYSQTSDHYHYCIAERDGSVSVVPTRDVRENARDVRVDETPYAAHVAARNSHAIGVAVCGMQDAHPTDFGAYPLRDDMLELACALVADLARAYAIPIDAEHVRTHAEAALDDGYFGDGEDQRWDIARLRPAAAPLRPGDAVATGDELRARIRASLRARRGAPVLWGTLGAALVAWALLLWHPWIDWFGR